MTDLERKSIVEYLKFRNVNLKKCLQDFKALGLAAEISNVAIVCDVVSDLAEVVNMKLPVENLLIY